MWQRIDRRLETIAASTSLREIILILFAASFIDFAATWGCINFLAGREAIPYARFLLDHCGWVGLITIRLAVILVIGLISISRIRPGA